MTILDEIIAYKRKQVEREKQIYVRQCFVNSSCYSRHFYSLKKALLTPQASGIIAEFKRKSPSEGFINKYAGAEKITPGYIAAGATALSVLTDSKYFGGSNEDMLTARKMNSCPILRKDFIVDEFQIVQARADGADVILLIAAALSKDEIKQFTHFAHQNKLEVLLEIHDETELDKIIPEIDVVGVNNRNLKDFSVDIQRSVQLAEKIPAEFVKISESGISQPESIFELRKAGFKGFLMGTSFMKTKDPVAACDTFIRQINNS